MRAKYMALEPSKNRYVKYMRSIRAIQDYLVGRAARHAVPSVNNTNVDRSVATIHATTLGCLRRQARVSLTHPEPACGPERHCTPQHSLCYQHQCGLLRGHTPWHHAGLPAAPGQGARPTPWACFG